MCSSRILITIFLVALSVAAVHLDIYSASAKPTKPDWMSWPACPVDPQVVWNGTKCQCPVNYARKKYDPKYFMCVKIVLEDVATLPQWSNWIDNDNPGGAGDYETSKSCPQPVDIECRKVGSLTIFKDPNSPPGYHCNTTEGGWCQNTATLKCEDIEVRFQCQGRMRDN